MTSISRLDRLVAQLRAQLRRRTPLASAATPGADSRVDVSSRQSQLSAVGQLKSAGVSEEGMLARRLVESLLQEELGRDLANDPGFQAMVQSVTDSLLEDEETRALCRQVIDAA